MAQDLYETLGVSKNATPEEIRKAYRKCALETHPDRHPNATSSEKEALENSFRQVSNAYEVLNDPETRREYDRYGTWPPPSPDEDRRRDHHNRTRSSSHHHHHHQRRHDPFASDPFSNDPFFRSSHRFNFTDPFEMFERIFSETMFGGSSFTRPNHHHHNRPQRRSTWDEDPFSQARRMHSDMFNFMSSMNRNMRSGFGDFPGNVGSTSGNGTSRFNQQVYMSSSTNGVTHTIKKTRDWNGNETVTRTYPDGRKVVTINGVEQRDPGYLPSSTSNPQDPRGPPVAHQGYNGGHSLPPPPYTGHSNHHADHREHRHRRSHDTREQRAFTAFIIHSHAFIPPNRPPCYPSDGYVRTLSTSILQSSWRTRIS
ncbi:DnaJ-domain-containing protein [Marasmius fiardii PR-910]|nr:DnaJ-domain-containing protein [Marasmius fiardii PR-910]